MFWKATYGSFNWYHNSSALQWTSDRALQLLNLFMYGWFCLSLLWSQLQSGKEKSPRTELLFVPVMNSAPFWVPCRSLIWDICQVQMCCMCGEAQAWTWSDTDIFTWASFRELFEEVEKSRETLAVIERSSVKVVGRSYGSSKAIYYHL